MLAPLFCTLPLVFSNLHVPHDNAHGVATAHLPNGQVETVIATQRECKVLRTRDEGLSWQPVTGGGLELGRPDVVVWDSHPIAQRFFIGTDEGIFSYDPMTGVVMPFNNGLPDDEESRWACQMYRPKSTAAPPLFMVNKLGQAWSLNRVKQRWELVLDSGFAEARGQIAAVPRFHGSAPAGPQRAVAAAFKGVLFLSSDGGDTWNIHAQFSQPATGSGDPLITAIEFAEDFTNSGNMVLATSVANSGNFTGDEGSIWHSSDYGMTFQRVHDEESSIRMIASTPQGPSGERWLMASVLRHPFHPAKGRSTGILRSSDGGATWDDYGTAQDFGLESDSSFTIGHGRELIHDFEVSADFDATGRVIFCRSEGLYYSRNEGLIWRRRSFRPTTQVRGLDSFIDLNGDLVAAAGSYGSGTWFQNKTTLDVTQLKDGASCYVDEVALSPKFTQDGMMLVGGARGLAFWFDPVLGATNPHQTYGWKAVPISRDVGYVRTFAFSPNFDARGLAGTDQTFFFSTSSASQSNYVTHDGGLTFNKLDKMIDDSDAPFMRHVAVAPTFDPNQTTGPIDVYAARSSSLFRLNGGKWEQIQTFGTMVTSIAVAPDFDRDPLTAAKPRLFISTLKPPYLVEFVDEIANPEVNELNSGLGDAAVVKVVCPPDFATSKNIYLATFSSGVRKLDLNQPVPTWTQVGQNFPNYWVTTMVLSPDFEQDKTIVVGSQAGLVIGTDRPGANWNIRKPPALRDNEAAEFHFYQPGKPNNPDANRTWRWDSVFSQPLDTPDDLAFIDIYIHYTDNDGSYVECFEYAAGVTLHTFHGPSGGEVDVRVENYWTGQLVAQKTQDLHAAQWANQKVQLDFSYQPVRIVVTANLDPGENLSFDGMTFWQK